MQTKCSEEHGQWRISQFQNLPFFLKCTRSHWPSVLQTSSSPVVWSDLLSGGIDGYTELQAYFSTVSKMALYGFYERSANN